MVRKQPETPLKNPDTQLENRVAPMFTSHFYNLLYIQEILLSEVLSFWTYEVTQMLYLATIICRDAAVQAMEDNKNG